MTIQVSNRKKRKDFNVEAMSLPEIEGADKLIETPEYNARRNGNLPAS